MRRPQFSGKRYLGNRNFREVHDLDREDTAPNVCQIDEIIRAGNAVTFTPDTLDQAHREGYDNYAKFLGRSTR